MVRSLILVILLIIVHIISCAEYTDYRKRLHLLPTICNGNDGRRESIRLPLIIIDTINQLVSAGDLSKARQIAYECLIIEGSSNERDNNHDYGLLLRECCPSTEKDVIDAYTSSADAFYQQNENYLELIATAHNRNDVVDSAEDRRVYECWDGKASSAISAPSSFGDILDLNEMHNMSPGSAAIERWNDCCSFFWPYNGKDSPACVDHENRYLCCDVAKGLDNHLILPALREPKINVRVTLNGKEEVIKIEQEGSLRMFDVAGVLWPAGYLLGLCLSGHEIPQVLDAMKGNLHRQPLAIELGTGVGFPSIALAKFLQAVMSDKVCDEHDNSRQPIIVATDTSDISLALTTSNVHTNGVEKLVTVTNANHTDVISLSKLHQQFAPTDGFDIVFGSSLQSLFDRTSRQAASLWKSLDVLLSNENENAIVVLSHVRTGDEKIELPPVSEGRLFECIYRISGDTFGMKTRDGHSSDFEVVVLRRRR